MHIYSPVLQGGVENMNKRRYAVHGVIFKDTIKGVNALTCFSNFIPRPEGRGYKLVYVFIQLFHRT